MSERRLQAGSVGYDVGQSPSKPVLIVDPDVGTVGDQKSALYDLIRSAAGNQAFPFDADTRCVEVQYLSLDSPNNSTYTMPETRIAVPQVEVGENDLDAADHAAFEMLRSLFAEALRSDEIALIELIQVAEGAGVSDDLLSAVTSEFSDEIAGAETL